MTEDYTATIASISTIFFVLSCLVFLLRISHRRIRQGCLIIDDALIVIAFCVLIAQFAIITKLATLGIGKRPTTTSARPQQNVLILRYALKIIGQAVIAISKLSIAVNCLEFSKINNGKYYQLFARGVVLFQILFIGSIIPFLVPCYPLSRSWTTTAADASVSAVAGCVNFTTLYTVMKAIGFVNDLFLLAVPIPIILRLPKRLAIQSGAFLLALGLVVILLDAIRLAFQQTYVTDMRTHAKSTFDISMATLICSWLKQYIIFIVACMPKARVTLMDMLHKHRETDSINDSSDTPIHLITSEMSTGEKDAFRRGEKLEHANESREIIVEYVHTSKQPSATNTPWHSLNGDLEEGLENDRHNWLDVTKANAYSQRHASIANTVSPISPFHMRVGEWEELYPSDEVQIKPFDSQFAIETTNILPFGSAQPSEPHLQSEVILCQANIERPEDRMTGRSALQKAYYDQVQAMRIQNAAIKTSQTTRTAFADLDVRRGSSTIPEGLFET